MVRVNLLPDWRKNLRQMEMARELCQYSFLFLGITVFFSAFIVLATLH